MCLFNSFPRSQSHFWTFILIGLLFLSLWPHSFIRAQENTPQVSSSEELFTQGADLFRQNKIEEANSKFNELHLREPQNVPVLFNWGLTEFKLGRKGMAVGAWRKALDLRPLYEPALQALTFARHDMKLKEDQDATTWLEGIPSWLIFKFLSLAQALSITALFLLIVGWSWLSYLGGRRSALREDQPLPRFPWVTGGAGLALFLVMTGFCGVKTFDFYTPKATAITTTPVRTGPSELSSTLFDLKEGSDVVLRQVKNGWTQIRHTGGMSGWVPNQFLFQTSGKLIW